MGKIPYRELSKEMKRLKAVIKTVPEDRRPIAEGLFDEIAFMDQTLQKLRQQVNEEGPISLFEQGKQRFHREHPALTAYNKTIQRMNQTIKQFLDLLPKATADDTKDELMDFIQGVS